MFCRFLKTSSPNHIFSSHHPQCRWEGKRAREKRETDRGGHCLSASLSPISSSDWTRWFGWINCRHGAPPVSLHKPSRQAGKFSDRSFALEMLGSDFPCFLLQPLMTTIWIRGWFGYPRPYRNPRAPTWTAQHRARPTACPSRTPSGLVAGSRLRSKPAQQCWSAAGPKTKVFKG